MSIRQLLEESAGELAAHDGVPVTIMHLRGAAANLGADIRRELDTLIAGVRPAGAAIAPPPAEEPLIAEVASGDATGDASADAPAAEVVSAPAAAPGEPQESASESAS